jgi:DNA-binding XRE family transcriptional regulator
LEATVAGLWPLRGTKAKKLKYEAAKIIEIAQTTLVALEE